MSLNLYFESDDGSLPEVEILFGDSARIPAVLGYLFASGGVDVSVGGSRVWLRAEEEPISFNGPDDANLVVAGTADPFHLVLQDIQASGTVIPALGVFVDPSRLTLDYRMGPHWGQEQINAFVLLLRQLRDMGGSIRVPWWGVSGEREFLDAIGGV